MDAPKPAEETRLPALPRACCLCHAQIPEDVQIIHRGRWYCEACEAKFLL